MKYQEAQYYELSNDEMSLFIASDGTHIMVQPDVETVSKCLLQIFFEHKIENFNINYINIIEPTAIFETRQSETIINLGHFHYTIPHGTSRVPQLKWTGLPSYNIETLLYKVNRLFRMKAFW